MRGDGLQRMKTEDRNRAGKRGGRERKQTKKMCQSQSSREPAPQASRQLSTVKSQKAALAAVTGLQLLLEFDWNSIFINFTFCL